MQTATDRAAAAAGAAPACFRLDRRTWIAAACGLIAAPPARSRRAAPRRMVAAWDDEAVHRVGVLDIDVDHLRPRRWIDVPTRAHGLLALPGGAFVAVARRPGDWLLIWWPAERRARWCWAEAQRRFNGHAALSQDGRHVFTTETDLDSGLSLVGVRDAASLRKTAEWPAQGIDAHELLVHAGALWVANGGVATRPETGRIKHGLQHMDSSLVRLDARSGRLLKQWRLADARLSLRHLAANGTRLGLALQAQHDDAAARAAAPALAVLEGGELRLPAGGPPLAGYGGDVAAFGAGFVVSSPRAGCVGLWQPDRRPGHRAGRQAARHSGQHAEHGWAEPLALREACALAVADGHLLAGGHPAALRRTDAGALQPLAAGSMRLDNHWLAV